MPATETISIIHRRTHVCFSFIFLSLSGRQGPGRVLFAFSNDQTYIDEYDRLDNTRRHRRKRLDTPSALAGTGFYRIYYDHGVLSENTFLFLFVLLLLARRQQQKHRISFVELA